METIRENEVNINEIITALENGAVLVCPTDTVYGLICDATNKKAVEKIYKIKKRQKSKPLGVFVRNIEMTKRYADISRDQEKKLKESWPGAITFILKAKQIEDGPLSVLVYKNGTIGMRMPDYNLIQKIFKEFNKPIAQTSVNISGQPPISKISDIIEQFGRLNILAINGGDLRKAELSKIIDLTKDKIKILRK